MGSAQASRREPYSSRYDTTSLAAFQQKTTIKLEAFHPKHAICIPTGSASAQEPHSKQRWKPKASTHTTKPYEPHTPNIRPTVAYECDLYSGWIGCGETTAQDARSPRCAKLRGRWRRSVKPRASGNTGSSARRLHWRTQTGSLERGISTGPNANPHPPPTPPPHLRLSPDKPNAPTNLLTLPPPFKKRSPPCLSICTAVCMQAVGGVRVGPSIAGINSYLYHPRQPAGRVRLQNRGPPRRATRVSVLGWYGPGRGGDILDASGSVRFGPTFGAGPNSYHRVLLSILQVRPSPVPILSLWSSSYHRVLLSILQVRPSPVPILSLWSSSYHRVLLSILQVRPSPVPILSLWSSSYHRVLLSILQVRPSPVPILSLWSSSYHRVLLSILQVRPSPVPILSLWSSSYHRVLLSILQLRRLKVSSHTTLYSTNY
ncbi:hypothetical protein JZ751_022510 [Albula glossodonta]|uniref:Uncharacterized protein n=1 Tax=Albula glossodonta TaxID=121402 RepID=A0A8T2MXA8_9TELE|nr:hypothetical protein JZ751_022510 [Albula glossodonta]